MLGNRGGTRSGVVGGVSGPTVSSRGEIGRSARGILLGGMKDGTAEKM